MKSRASSSVTSSPMKKEEVCFYRYLKPGALARIRDSKFTAKLKRPSSRTSLMDVKLISSSWAAMILQAQMTEMPMDAVPSFPFKIGQFSPCSQRKKVFAVAPTFSDIQSQ